MHPYETVARIHEAELRRAANERGLAARARRAGESTDEEGSDTGTAARVARLIARAAHRTEGRAAARRQAPAAC